MAVDVSGLGTAWGSMWGKVLACPLRMLSLRMTGDWESNVQLANSGWPGKCPWKLYVYVCVTCVCQVISGLFRLCWPPRTFVMRWEKCYLPAGCHWITLTLLQRCKYQVLPVCHRMNISLKVSGQASSNGSTGSVPTICRSVCAECLVTHSGCKCSCSN